MLKFIFAMIIPLIIFIYTCSFGRWMFRKKLVAGAVSAYCIAALAMAASASAFWRMFL